MITELGAFKGLLGGGWSVAAKPCDSCNSGAAAVFCRAHSAFLCLACNAKIHLANNRHELVGMCEVCEQAPAAVTCKADAASLCVTCDADIHSANPLAQRHDRVPVKPFFDSAVRSSAFNLFDDETIDTRSVPIVNPIVKSNFVDTLDLHSGPVFFPEIDDPFLEFDYPKSIGSRLLHHSVGTDSVVPVHTKPLAAPVIDHRSSQFNCFDMDLCISKLSSFNYPSQSITQSVSSSSQEVGVVPDGNFTSISDISYSMGRTEPACTVAPPPTQLCGMDREARVMRYREKRKNRKFEKTIRYASRKAYAETRPRIKGRFAKRTENGADADGPYSSAASSVHIGDYQYGVVPSF